MCDSILLPSPSPPPLGRAPPPPLLAASAPSGLRPSLAVVCWALGARLSATSALLWPHCCGSGDSSISGLAVRKQGGGAATPPPSQLRPSTPLSGGRSDGGDDGGDDDGDADDDGDGQLELPPPPLPPLPPVVLLCADHERRLCRRLRSPLVGRTGKIQFGRHVDRHHMIHTWPRCGLT
eukprot:COSAG01_NODE_6987_length_3402_cov_2.489252_2_plen_179_part_00